MATERAPDSGADPLAALPRHVAFEVLGKLDSPHYLAAAGTVCASWRALAEAEAQALWGSLYGRHFPSLSAERLAPGVRESVLAQGWRERYRWRRGLAAGWAGGAARLAATLEGHAAWVNAVALDEAAGLVVSGGSEGAVRAWRLDDEEAAEALPCHEQAVWSLAAERGTALSGGADGAVALADLHAGRLLCKVDLTKEADGHRVCVPSVQLLAGGAAALVGCQDGRLWVVDLRTGRCELGWSAIAAAGNGRPGSSISQLTQLSAARAHGHKVVAGGDAAALPVFDMRRAGGQGASSRVGQLEAHPTAQQRPHIFTLDVRESWLCLAGSGGHVQVWGLAELDAGGSGRPLAKKPGAAARPAAGGGADQRMVYAARLTAEGSVLAAGHDGHVRLLEPTPQPARGSCWGLRHAWQLAPSLADPGCMAVDPLTGFLSPLPMHAVDASLTHLAVAGRDASVRIYAFAPAEW